MLLVVDYIIEGIGGVTAFIIVFASKKNLLMQYVLFTVIRFLYGILIPISYLINEKRVKNIVMESGWVAGFKSIFHSDETIRRLDRERLRNILARESQPPRRVNTPQTRENQPPIRIDMTQARENQPSIYVITTPACENQLPIRGNTTDIIENQSLSTVQGSPLKKRKCKGDSITSQRAHKKRNLGKWSNRIGKVSENIPNNLSIATKTSNAFNTEVNNKSRDNNAAGQSATCCRGMERPLKTPKRKMSSKQSLNSNFTPANLVDIEHDDDQTLSQHSSAFVDTTGNKRHGLQERLPYTPAPLVLPHYKEANKICSFLRDENFKSFARDYILRRTLRSLNNNENEVNYLVYLQHLCNLEELLLKEMCDQISLDFITSLTNAWHLFKKRSTQSKGDGYRTIKGSNAKRTELFTDSSKRKENSPTGNIHRHSLEQYVQRKRFIDILISNVSIDSQYSHYLKKLCDMKECW